MKVQIKGVYCKRKTLKSGEVRAYYYHRDTGRRLPDDPTSPEFFQKVRQLNKQPIGTARAERSFSDLVRHYRSSIGYRELAVTTRKEYDRHIKYVEPMLGSFLVAQIQRKHLEQIMAMYAEMPTLARSIGRTMSLLFSYALDKLQWIEANPFLRMQNQRVRRQKESGQRPYTEAEIARFRQANPLGSRERLAFEIALVTALRIEDIVNVPAADMLAETIPIRVKKTGEIISVAVGRQMRDAWLAWEETRKKAGGGASRYAVCSIDGSSLNKCTLSHEMLDAYKRAEFDEGQRTHALRYTACIRLLEAGYAFGDIAEHTGHRMASMAAEYCRKRRNAVERGMSLGAVEEMQEKRLAASLLHRSGDAEQSDVPGGSASFKTRRLN